MAEILGLTSDQVVGGVYGLLLLGLAAVQYFNNRSRKTPTSAQDSVTAGFGARYDSEVQTERLIEQTTRVADALVRIGEIMQGKQVDEAFSSIDERIAAMARQLEIALDKPRAMLGRVKRRQRRAGSAG